MQSYRLTIPGAPRPVESASIVDEVSRNTVSTTEDDSADRSRQAASLAQRDALFFQELEQQQIQLNDDQVQAVRHGDGPLLTIAGAGSGKTTTLACRAAYLMQVRRVSPRHLLLVTFSRKAADEMKQRLAEIPGVPLRAAQSVEARTFHSFCLQLLRRNGVRSNVLGDDGQQRMTIKRLLRESGTSFDFEPESLLALLSSYKCRLLTASDLPEASPAEREIKRVLLRYEQWKQAGGMIDFDDLLLLTYNKLSSEPELLAALQDRFHYIMVDEFQDTNTVQYEIVRLIAGERRNLMVVGDDDQTIYSFNGASSEAILSFDKVYPDAKVVALRINYRSSAEIVGLGNAIIRGNKHRRPKTLTVPAGRQRLADGSDDTVEAAIGVEGKPLFARPATAEEEAALITTSIRKLIEHGGYSYGDIAVLYRSAGSGRATIEHLLQAGIPIEEHGDLLSFYESPLIRPVMAHLKLALQHRDKQAIEMMLPTLYVNRESAMRWIRDKDAQQAKKWPLIHLTSLPGLQQFQKDAVIERLRLIKAAATQKPAAAIRRIRDAFFDKFAETNRGGTPHKELMKELLDELESSAGRFETVESFVAFAEDMVKRQAEAKGDVKPDSSEGSNGEGRVQVMTIHRSKGLEFPAVFVIGASEGIMPHRSAIQPQQPKQTSSQEETEREKEEALEEERRLMYVAVTRARERLYVSSPAFYHGQKAELSRFLAEAGGVRQTLSAAGSSRSTRRTMR
ncbi:DNA helicase-2/ATP-dependent DNA helicase PcrA [Paenibacillus cellulosilyticus]|uniref:DNA 3'-5' helicase n=1 Tax=Paenibacillus cellulosilyticus TaxID=375489 RepID=A0A2V2YL64_9BACL|nr:ATP-dependent helicase [Paenibacillus cellulosilyticus]PWV94383.1 DNA helicase-2/ATP-dependent DNA helicase PcrA [Paenibacillus cellulosilyticus]QKS43887.1 ATP-dependent helicase [Paenibacillus cellulosilyticus]